MPSLESDYGYASEWVNGMGFRFDMHGEHGNLKSLAEHLLDMALHHVKCKIRVESLYALKYGCGNHYELISGLDLMRICRRFDTMTDDEVVVANELLGMWANPTTLPYIEKFRDSPNSQVRVSALDAIDDINEIINFEQLKSKEQTEASD